MPIRKLRKFLEGHHVKYVVISHSTAYTALEVAELAHISGRKLAKTVIVKINGQIAMAVLPASYAIDFKRFKETSGIENIELANEDDFMGLFQDCEIGAMPPFGNLYGMNVFVELSLAEDKEIAFNAGNHRELIKLSFEDFDRLVKPERLNFAFHPANV